MLMATTAPTSKQQDSSCTQCGQTASTVTKKHYSFENAHVERSSSVGQWRGPYAVLCLVNMLLYSIFT